MRQDGGVTITDADLRENYEFIKTFEGLRRQHGFREMSDSALTEIAEKSGHSYEELRIARHVRNALAHDDLVNRETLRRIYRSMGGSQHAPTTEIIRDSGTSGPALRIHGWRDQHLEQQMLANGFISVGGDEIGDLRELGDFEAVREHIRSTMTARSDRAIAIFVGYWRRFAYEAAVGDLVVLPTQLDGVAIGEIQSGYFYVPTADEHLKHRLQVNWIALGIDRCQFGEDLQRTLSGRHTVQEFKARRSNERLRVIASGRADPGE